MSEWLLVAELAELKHRKRKQVQVAGTSVALFLIGDRVFALRDTCVHKQRLLSKGTVLHGKIVCPGHQWEFDPETGRAEDQDEYQPTYDVRVTDGHIYVDPRERMRVSSPGTGVTGEHMPEQSLPEQPVGGRS